MSRFGSLGLTLVLGALASAATPLSTVPGNAPIVVQLNGYDKAQRNLGAFLSNSLPDLGPKLITQMRDGINGLLNGRELTGLDQEARLFAVVHDFKDIQQNPTISIVVPVKDGDAFLKAFLTEAERKTLKAETGYQSFDFGADEAKTFVVVAKETVTFCRKVETAKEYVKGVDSLEKTLSKESATAFLKTDIGVYVSLKAVNAEFGDVIKQSKGLLEGILQQQGEGGKIDKKQLATIKTVSEGAIQMVLDGEELVFGFEFLPIGVKMVFKTRFGETTDTNNVLKKMKPTALAELDTLPSGQAMYSAQKAGDLMTSDTIKALAKMQMAEDPNKKTQKLIDKAITEMLGGSSGITLSGGNFGKTTLQIDLATEPAKNMAAFLTLMRTLTPESTFLTMALKGKPKVTENAETLNEVKFNAVEIEFDIDKSVKKLPEESREASRTMMLKIYGEGLKMWVGTDGKKMYSATAPDWKSAKKMIEGAMRGFDPIGKSDEFRETRKQMPAQASLLMLADTGGLLEYTFEMVKEMGQAIPGFPGGALPVLKAPEGKPAFIGFSLVLEERSGSFELFVPTSAVQQGRKFLGPLLNMDN